MPFLQYISKKRLRKPSFVMYVPPLQGLGEQDSPLGLPHPHCSLVDFGSYLAFIRQYLGWQRLKLYFAWMRTIWCFSVFDKFDGNKCVVSEWVSLKYSSRWKQQKYWYWNACKILMRTGTEQQEDWMDWLLRAVYAKTIKLLLKMLSSSSSILVYIHRLTSIF